MYHDPNEVKGKLVFSPPLLVSGVETRMSGLEARIFQVFSMRSLTEPDIHLLVSKYLGCSFLCIHVLASSRYHLSKLCVYVGGSAIRTQVIMLALISLTH